MSYVGISIKEAMSKINREWFLPAVQRPYVWGSRYDSERYICKLFDSLYQNYPIGGIIMWHTEEKVAYRHFLTDYHPGDVYRNAEEGTWGKDKHLIYDGQQRLQTLFSCLNHTFNNRVLVFNLAYNPDTDTDVDTGFRFIDRTDSPDPMEIKMTELFTMTSETKGKVGLRKRFKTFTEDSDIQDLIETNLDQLWSVFVEGNVKSIAYFSIQSDTEDKVNEIFERLNTGGIPLSKADLLFSRIKAKYPEFEADIMSFCKNLSLRTHLALESYDVLQILHMIVRKRSRVDENVDSDLIDAFNKEWNLLQEPLNAYFDNYLRNRLHISHMAIVRNKIPLLVIAIFFHEYYRTGKKYRDMESDLLRLIDKFFIIAEFNDWALQSYADNFTRIIQDNSNKEQFPYNEIEEFVRYKGNRPIDLTEQMFISYRWMALKFLMPDREFEFDSTMLNRFNPELDHIFPVNLKNMDDKYRNYVDIVWNMQPIKGEANNLKSNHHPKDFFTDKCRKSDGTPINGSKYFNDYDFVPDITDSSWDDYKAFIDNRREKMIQYLKNRYDITIEHTNIYEVDLA